MRMPCVRHVLYCPKEPPHEPQPSRKRSRSPGGTPISTVPQTSAIPHTPPAPEPAPVTPPLMPPVPAMPQDAGHVPAVPVSIPIHGQGSTPTTPREPSGGSELSSAEAWLAGGAPGGAPPARGSVGALLERQAAAAAEEAPTTPQDSVMAMTPSGMQPLTDRPPQRMVPQPRPPASGLAPALEPQVRHMSDTCQTHVRHMSDTCQTHVIYMSDTCSAGIGGKSGKSGKCPLVDSQSGKSGCSCWS